MAMSKLNKGSVQEVDDMTMTDFNCLLIANHEQNLYKEYLLHKQAFAFREVKATKNVGTEKKPKEEYVFKNFEEFFDYEKAMNQLKNFEEYQKNEKDLEAQRKEITKRIAEVNKRKLQGKEG